jgi:cold shock CspA family protein
VVAFDGPSGLGEIAVADGTTIPFHCVSIADGSRTIEVGAAVRFEELRKLGRLEAARIEPT